MDKNIQNTAKGRKMRSQGETGFLAAFVFGLLITVVLWIGLSALAGLLLGFCGDGGAFVKLVSPAVLVVSLFLGGFATGKRCKNAGASAAMLSGTAFMGISYIVSTLFKLTNGMSVYLKTAYILLYIIIPVFGARVSKNNKKASRRRNRK